MTARLEPSIMGTGMKEAKRRAQSDDVLSYHPHDGRRRQGTVRRYYDMRRSANGRSQCCDEPGCMFNGPDVALNWNNKPFKLILDHKNGDSRDDSEDNLQLLCPMCNSQRYTHGGGNKGRVQWTENSSRIKKENNKDYDATVGGRTMSVSATIIAGKAEASTE